MCMDCKSSGFELSHLTFEYRLLLHENFFFKKSQRHDQQEHEQLIISVRFLHYLCVCIYIHNYVSITKKIIVIWFWLDAGGTALQVE